MKINKDNPNRNFLLHNLKNIIKTGNGYILQNCYKELNDEEIVAIGDVSLMDYSKHNCDICIHHTTLDSCLIRNQLEKLPPNHFRYCNTINKCDAYEPIQELTIIKSKEEMVQFIEKTENFFGCPEDYENYYGFERIWDEEGDGSILETTKEYYDRGGDFANIPDKFPCVIYFGIIDDDCVRSDLLKWIYIGE